MLDEAEAEQRAFEQLRATFHPEDRVKHNVHLVDMGGVASAILDAEVKYRADDLQVWKCELAKVSHPLLVKSGCSLSFG